MNRNIDEKIDMDKASMGDVIKDFRASDAPQFKGKSKKKRTQMAIAAKLEAQREERIVEQELKSLLESKKRIEQQINRIRFMGENVNHKTHPHLIKNYNDIIQQIDELKRSTLASYIKKSSTDAANRSSSEELTEASFTAAASMHAATRKQSGGKTAQPTHGFRVGDQVTTKDGKQGQITFVQGDTVHVKGTNNYYPDRITHHSVKDLKEGLAEEVELDEGTFAPTMKKAIAAHERGDHKMAKYHLDNAKTARYAMKSTDIAKHKELLDKYEKLRDMHEEVELDELNKSTLGSYIKKASHDVAHRGALTRQYANDSEEARKKEKYSDARKSNEKADKQFNKSWKRRMNIAKAVDKLTKEEAVSEVLSRDSYHRNFKSRELEHELGNEMRPTRSKPKDAEHRFYHNVPYAKKEQAKAEGMKFDGGVKKWYHQNIDRSQKSAFERHRP